MNTINLKILADFDSTIPIRPSDNGIIIQFEILGDRIFFCCISLSWIIWKLYDGRGSAIDRLYRFIYILKDIATPSPIYLFFLSLAYR